MTDYNKKEEKVLNKIDDEFAKLDANLTKMDETDSKVKEYIAQEKAIHNIHEIVRKAKKYDKLVADEEQDYVDTVYYEADRELEIAQDIDNEFDKLEATLNKLDESPNKVTAYFEQKKAIHEAKKILKDSDLLD